MPNGTSLYDVGFQGSTWQPRKRQWGNPKLSGFQRRCLVLFWLTFAFAVVAILLLAVSVYVPLGNWNLLIYLIATGYLLSLVWWVYWFTCNVDPEFDDPEPNESRDAWRAPEDRVSGSSTPSFENPATPVGFLLASLKQSGHIRTSSMNSSSSQNQASSSTLPGGGRRLWMPWPVQLSRSVGSWMAKHLRAHPSSVAVQPQDQASPMQVPGPRRPRAGPRLVSSHDLPRPQPSSTIWSSMPTLSTAGCPPCLLPAHSCSSPWLPQLLTGQSLQATLKCPPQAPVQGHPPAAQSPVLAWPGGPRPLGPPFLQPRPKTTMPQPVPSLCQTTGDHADAPVLHASSSEGTTVRKILVQPRTPGQVQQPQGPGSPGAEAPDPRVSDLCPIDC